MSTINSELLADRLTRDRLSSYLQATAGDVASAIDLYDWNVAVSAALYEDLSRLEVIFRNAFDAAMVEYGSTQGWALPWYRQHKLFSGRRGIQATKSIDEARRRVRSDGRRRETHGRVVAELNFGFWRYLCTKSYLTSMWVPAIAPAFGGHPHASDARRLRADVDALMERLHTLRNRIAHHEPIHRRDLKGDHAAVLQLVSWISPDAHSWIRKNSRTVSVIDARP